ncbi:hypothetical protein [Streptomyces sp. Ru73]|uniref:hypothetical protein n=1 Tax=Streptomyces sp. Ru73 TaxID=2080748 RepID=UPI0011AFF92A|nr:hypothetical protein [Streptomyces sp. Ru73]
MTDTATARTPPEDTEVPEDPEAPEGTDEAGHPEPGHPVPGPIDDGEARLAYGDVIHARHRLGLGGLSWSNDHPVGTLP